MPDVRPSGLTIPKRDDPDGYSHTMAADRIGPLDEVWSYIEAIDFGSMKQNMQDRSDGLGWSARKCDWAEQQYKRWLFLRRKHENEAMPPNVEIDKFWHEHMLDTRSYFRDTARIFGYYQHHFPYFGARGDADEEDLNTTWRTVCQRFMAEFGDYPWSYEEHTGA